MRKVFVISTVLMLALAGLAFARPADQQGKDAVRFALTDGTEQRTTQSAPNGIFGLANHTCAGGAGSTTWFGGTHWDAVDGDGPGGETAFRWEANMGGEWHFDSGIARKRVAGKDVLLEGWTTLDNTFSALPFFRRLGSADVRWAGTLAEPVCVGLLGGAPLAGTYSMWCGVFPAEADSACFSDGQGYGNGWNITIQKAYTFSNLGSVTVAFKHKYDAEAAFDFCELEIDTGGASVIVPSGGSFTGSGAGTPSFTLTAGVELPTVAKQIKIQFHFSADGGYSDSDGLNATKCGGWAVDDINVTGAVLTPGLTDFEAGDGGWKLVVLPGIGGENAQMRYLGSVPAFPLSDPCLLPIGGTCLSNSFTGFHMCDTVVTFYDGLTGKITPDCDNEIESPPADLIENGFGTIPGKVLEWDVYAELPLLNYVFVNFAVRYYPLVCPATGLPIISGYVNFNTVYYTGETPVGRRFLFSLSALVSPDAEWVTMVIGAFNACKLPFAVPDCTGITNSTPYFDNARLGVFGNPQAPLVILDTFDYFQDSFPTDGSLNPASAGRIDMSTLRSSPNQVQAGSFLGDTLHAQGDGAPNKVGHVGSETHVVFKVWPGKFNTAAINAWWLKHPATGVGWRYARMDTARGNTGVAIPGNWMGAYHPSDPNYLIGGNPKTTNDTFPDEGLFTPGTRICYFIRSAYMAGDIRGNGMAGEAREWFLWPDTCNANGAGDGYNYLEVEVLPSSMDTDTSFNCVLYADAFSHRGGQQFIEDGLAEHYGVCVGKNCEKTCWDRWDKESPSSGVTCLGRPLNSVIGATLKQLVGYSTIIYNSGNLSAKVLELVDADVIGPHLTLTEVKPTYFYGSGDGLARSMNASGNQAKAFLNTTLGATLIADTYRTKAPGDTSFCVELIAAAGIDVTFPAMCLSKYARGNGCQPLRSFDVLGVNGSILTAKGNLSYKNQDGGGAVTDFQSVTNNVVPGADSYKTVIDGVSVHYLRGTSGATGGGGWPTQCEDSTCGKKRIWEVLSWFGPASLCKPLAVALDAGNPGGGKVPAYRTQLGLAYPNPMNPTTTIKYSVGAKGPVEVRIFSVGGALVKTLVSGSHEPGDYSAVWDGSSDNGKHVASGVFFYQLYAPKEGIRSARKLVVVQ